MRNDIIIITTTFGILGVTFSKRRTYSKNSDGLLGIPYTKLLLPFFIVIASSNSICNNFKEIGKNNFAYEKGV